jgi:hypothetical protein
MPGSLSTVVLAMLGRRSALWPAPELHIFSAENLEQLTRADKAAAARFGIEGTFTAGLAVCLHGLGLLGKGPLKMENFERWRNERCLWLPGQILDLLDAAAAPRQLIIKSGLLALDRHALARLRDARRNVSIIILVRHPLDTVMSLLRRARDPQRPGLAGYLLSIWLAILRSEDLPGQRPLPVLKAEDVLMQPRASLAPVLSALKLPFHEDTLRAMMRTEESYFLPAARQLPGLIADDSFVSDPRLRPRTPSRGLIFPASWRISNGLAQQVRDAAIALGYS